MKLIPGKKYWVADSEIDWVINNHLEFVITHNDVNYFDTNGDLIYWRLVREIPKAHEHYTAETFPKGEVWIRKTNFVDSYGSWLVQGITGAGVEIKECSPYWRDLSHYDLSTDGRRTWRKAVPGAEE